MNPSIILSAVKMIVRLRDTSSLPAPLQVFYRPTHDTQPQANHLFN